MRRAAGRRGRGSARRAGPPPTARPRGPSARGRRGRTRRSTRASSSRRPPAAVCDKCGGEVGDDGYCTTCGHRALEPVTVVDGTALAYATHRGRRHHRNEDSAALAVTAEGWPVIAVSDGVSISPNPHLASRAAVDAAVARLGGRPFAGADDLVAAVSDAHVAASAVPNDTDPHWTPDGSHAACTIVRGRGHPVRACTWPTWATPGATWPGPTGRAGRSSSSRSTTASRPRPWPRASPPTWRSTCPVATPSPPGWAPTPTTSPPTCRPPRSTPSDLVLVCSDGLWNYAPTDEALGALVTATLPPPAAEIPLAAMCEHLVDWANEQGGADNICVALAPAPSGGGPASRRVRDEAAGGRVTHRSRDRPVHGGDVPERVPGGRRRHRRRRRHRGGRRRPGGGRGPPPRRATGPR